MNLQTSPEAPQYKRLLEKHLPIKWAPTVLIINRISRVITPVTHLFLAIYRSYNPIYHQPVDGSFSTQTGRRFGDFSIDSCKDDIATKPWTFEQKKRNTPVMFQVMYPCIFIGLLRRGGPRGGVSLILPNVP